MRKDKLQLPRLTAEVTPWSSVVGQMLTLKGESGEVYCLLSLRALRGDVKPIGAGYGAVAEWLAGLVNDAATKEAGR